MVHGCQMTEAVKIDIVTVCDFWLGPWLEDVCSIYEGHCLGTVDLFLY